MMTQHLPSFRHPPVAETALSVQFEPLKGFGNVHLGAFYEQIRDQYPNHSDADLIEPKTERFGQAASIERLPRLRIAASQPAPRLQMASADNHMMVQLQNGRLVYNWRRIDGNYPRWERVKEGFDWAYSQFCDFLQKSGFDKIEPNQWDVTYLNQLFRGHEWNEPGDWQALLPGLIGTTAELTMGTLEGLGANFHFVLPEQRGRLHVDLASGFAGTDEAPQELLSLQLTARGGIDQESGHDLDSGLTLGREAIVLAFAELTGTEAHKVWERDE